MADRFHRDRLKAIQVVVNGGKLGAVARFEELAARGLRDGLQGGFVDFFLPDRGRVTDRDGMDRDAAVLRHAGGLVRGHSAGGVVAVGQGDHRLGRQFAVFEERDAEPHGIAEGGARARHAHLSLVEQLPAKLEVGGEGGLHEGRIAEYHQADPVALAFDQEIIEDLLDDRKAIHALSGSTGEVLVLHRAGEVDQQQEVAGGEFAGDRGLQPLGTGRRCHDERPDQSVQEPLRGLTRGLRHGGAMGLGKLAQAGDE